MAATEITDLGKCKPEDFFSAAALPEYKKRFEAIWQRLVLSNTSWVALQAVRCFPADLLLSPSQQVFLGPVQHNFTAQIILGVVSVLCDEHSDALTFDKLRRWMKGNCSAGRRDALQRHLDSIVTDKELEETKKTARGVRDRVLAHHDRRGLDGLARLTYDGVETMLKEATRLLDALSIGAGYGTVDVEYLPSTQGCGGPDESARACPLPERKPPGDGEQHVEPGGLEIRQHGADGLAGRRDEPGGGSGLRVGIPGQRAVAGRGARP
jgi:hypothetical protein